MLSLSHLCCQLHNSPLHLWSELGRGVLPLLEVSVLVVARLGHQTLLVDGALHLPLLLLLDLLHPDQGHVTCYMVTTNVIYSYLTDLKWLRSAMVRLGEHWSSTRIVPAAEWTVTKLLTLIDIFKGFPGRNCVQF